MQHKRFKYFYLAYLSQHMQARAQDMILHIVLIYVKIWSTINIIDLYVKKYKTHHIIFIWRDINLVSRYNPAYTTLCNWSGPWGILLFRGMLWTYLEHIYTFNPLLCISREFLWKAEFLRIKTSCTRWYILGYTWICWFIKVPYYLVHTCSYWQIQGIFLVCTRTYHEWCCCAALVQDTMLFVPPYPYCIEEDHHDVALEDCWTALPQPTALPQLFFSCYHSSSQREEECQRQATTKQVHRC